MKTDARQSRTRRAVLGVALIAGCLAIALPVHAKKAFARPAPAADALVDGLARNDDAQIKTVLGADSRHRIAPGPGSAADKTAFLEARARGHRIVEAGENKAIPEVGTNGWTPPIRIARIAPGGPFDTQAAPAQMRLPDEPESPLGAQLAQAKRRRARHGISSRRLPSSPPAMHVSSASSRRCPRRCGSRCLL